jgi:hypothetical protein
VFPWQHYPSMKWCGSDIAQLNYLRSLYTRALPHSCTGCVHTASTHGPSPTRVLCLYTWALPHSCTGCVHTGPPPLLYCASTHGPSPTRVLCLYTRALPHSCTGCASTHGPSPTLYTRALPHSCTVPLHTGPPPLLYCASTHGPSPLLYCACTVCTSEHSVTLLQVQLALMYRTTSVYHEMCGLN